MSILSTVPPILSSEDQQDQVAIVDLLKETLAQALEGKITSVAVVACMRSGSQTGYAHAMAGRQAADLNLGCDSVKAEILRRTENEGMRRQRKL